MQPAAVLHPFVNAVRLTARPQSGRYLATWGNLLTGPQDTLHSITDKLAFPLPINLAFGGRHSGRICQR